MITNICFRDIIVIYCPTCKEALSGASCEVCGRVYTWKLGTVDTYKPATGAKEAPADEAFKAG